MEGSGEIPLGSSTPLAPLMGADTAATSGGRSVRSPKTAELVARTLRRMVVDGQLKDGDYLPNEGELMQHFGVSRPTLREAVRVLESDRLVEVRRGSRTGARVRVPGPEIVARPAGLLLEISGVTIADVITARSAIEPMAARLLAAQTDPRVYDELESIVAEVPDAFEADQLAEVSARFHRRMVELSGNATLGVIAGMLNEITERHTEVSIKRQQKASKSDYDNLIRSYHRLIDLLRAGDADEAEAHWRRHMDISRKVQLSGQESIRVRDVME
jgi:GntR family transcriptional regulator, transcriptional repressor for pyruvate dehydrogenase complex